MIKHLNIFFGYLDRYHIPTGRLTSLKGVGSACFQKLVVDKYKQKLDETAISLFDHETHQGGNLGKDQIKDIIKLYDCGQWGFFLENINNYFCDECILCIKGDGSLLMLDIVNCWADCTNCINWGYNDLKSSTVHDINRVNEEIEAEVIKAKNQSFLCLGPYIGLMARQKCQRAKRGNILGDALKPISPPTN